MAVTSSIGGHAFFDDNANIQQDGTEANLFAGFPVDLYSANGKVLYGSTTTDASGNYSFTGLSDGTYALRFHTGGGFRGDQGSTTGDGFNWLTGVTVNNAAATTVNQGFYAGNGGTISGLVGVDANGNHQIDAGEGQSGVIVQVHDQSGNLVGSTQTAQDGSWSFSGLAGTYDVQVVDPLGQVVPGGASKSVTTTVGGAASGTTFVLTNAPTGTAPTGSGGITGHTFFDPNANGVQEAGEANLYKGFGVDIYNAGGSVHYGSTATDASGNYSFSNLADGTYALRFQTFNGYHGDQGIMAPNGFSWQTVTVSNGAATILDQGFTTANAGSIAGTVYADTNGNGHIDTSDGGVNGAVVTLLDGTGHAIQTATTGSNGFYYFNGLGSGTYSVQFDPGLGHAIVDSPTTVTRTVVNGTPYNNENILTTSPDKVATSLSGTVFADTNGNGKLDGGEVGVAGAHVAVMDGSGYVVATLTTDENGHYSLPNPVAGQNYRVVVSPPTGYASENAQGATGLTLTAGQPLDHVDLGLSSATPATTVAPPAVTEVINVVVRGQSNTYFPTVEGTVEAMREQIEHLLGFDGVNQRVNVVAVNNDPNYANTEVGGTGLTNDWLHPNGSDWASTTLERGYLSALNQIPVADRGAPTAILMLHNEWDSDVTTGLTAARWESAMRYEAGLARAVLGLSANDAPYLYVSPIPFAVGAPQQPLQNQAIAVGQAELSADPAFNAKVVTLQSSDVTMDHDGANGGFHLNTQDQQTLYGRAALGIAQEFAASAMPGSPLSQANGNIDNLGPQVTQVATVAGHPNQLLLTLGFDAATNLQALNNVAAAGLGWSVRADYTDATADANGTAAQLVDANHLLVTFDNTVPSGERLFYTWGSLRLAQNNGPGNGNAIYDNNGLPLSVDPHGLAIGYTAAGGPVIAGTVANQATAQAAINPFATTTLADPNTGATDSMRITVAGAGGTLTGTGLVATNDGAYTLTGSAADITKALQAVTFAPSATHTGTTTFTLQALSNGYPTATTDSVTTVVTKPAVAGITAVLANDTGASPTDGKSMIDVVTGVTDANASVILTDESNHVIGGATADANGRYTIAPTGLADGVHTLTATELYLGVSTGHASIAFTLDSTAPSAPVLALANDTGRSGTDHITADASLKVTPAEAGGSLAYTVDGKAVAAYDPAALGQGTHTVAVTQTDDAGNVSAAGTLTFTLDSVAPSITDSGLSGPTSVNGPSALSGAVDAADAGATVTIREGTTVLGTTVADAQGHFVFPLPSDFGSGTQAHDLTASATDAAGNTGDTFVFHIDPTANQLLFGSVTHDATTAGGEAYALYDGLLGRATAPTELEFWASQLAHGASLHDTAAAILGSDEFTADYGGAYTARSDAAFVDYLYEHALGRTGDAQGEAYWEGLLASGTSRVDVATSFALSPENLSQIAPALQAGVFVPDAEASNVARLYYAIFDRAPDADGLQYWSNVAHAATPLTSIAASFLDSAEYAGLHPTAQTDLQYVDGLYADALGRPADSTGEAHWTDLLAHGGTRAQVATSIAQSPEAQAHLAGQIETGWHLT